MDTNLLKLNKDLIESKQSNVGEQIATQVGNVFSALKKFEDDTEALAIENADLLEADAIGVDLLPEAGKEFMYSEFTRIGEEMADAVNRKDKKRIRDLKLEGTNLIAAQNTIGQMLKDHANDLFGTGGEGNYSKGSNKLMMNMLMNKEYSIRKDGREMVIDFNGPNGKKGVKITDLDKHVYLKIDDLAINYDNEIKNIRQAAIKGLPFEKDAFAKVVNQTLNTVPKLVSSIWDDSFTLKDGKTMKELWEAEPKNAGKDANQYLRSGGDNWDENAIREFAKEKLMQGGTNDFTAYSPKNPNDDDDADGVGNPFSSSKPVVIDGRTVGNISKQDRYSTRRAVLDNKSFTGYHGYYEYQENGTYKIVGDNSVFKTGSFQSKYDVLDTEGARINSDVRNDVNMKIAPGQVKWRELFPSGKGDDATSTLVNEQFELSDDTAIKFIPFTRQQPKSQGGGRKSYSDNIFSNDFMAVNPLTNEDYKDEDGNVIRFKSRGSRGFDPEKAQDQVAAIYKLVEEAGEYSGNVEGTNSSEDPLGS